jgi:two-component system cell cycle response regulator
VGRIILLVEEDATMADLIRVILHQEPGCVVLWVRDCAKALDLLQQDLRPDHILLDLAFPYADGLAFHDHLQRDPGTAAIPLLILTVHPTDPAITARNFAAVLPKPFDLSAFEASMNLSGSPFRGCCVLLA